MGNAYKIGDSITLYFGDTMRELLSKSLRKRNIYFVDCKIIGICVKKDDNHILPEGVLEGLRVIDKDNLLQFASDHGYNAKEFKEALKPYRKDRKKD